MIPMAAAPRAVQVSAAPITPATRPPPTPLWRAAGLIRSWKISP
jgi:hypothetical protein